MGASPELALTTTDSDSTDWCWGAWLRRDTFSLGSDGIYTISQGGKPATTFLFDLIGRLQKQATVPMIDIAASSGGDSPECSKRGTHEREQRGGFGLTEAR